MSFIRFSVHDLGARLGRAPFLFSLALILPFGVSVGVSVGVFAATSKLAISSTARVAQARELVLKGERLAASALLKDVFREESAKNPVSESTKTVVQAWREIAEIFLTDRGQSQFSLADSIWLSKPKEALDSLTPLLKSEDGNLAVSRLGARAALRSIDCARAETFVQKAEEIYPIGFDVKLLRLQVKSCFLGSDARAKEVEVPAALIEFADVEPAVRALQLREALRRDDAKSFKSILAIWELRSHRKNGDMNPSDDPEYWYLKWKKSTLGAASTADRTSGRNYLRLCSEMTPRRRKLFAIHPELCLHTETVESQLKSSEKTGL